MPGLLALRETGIEPLTLEAKEGLALLKRDAADERAGRASPSPMPTVWRGPRPCRAAQSVEALLATDVPFAAVYQLARPHPGQIAVCRRDAAPPPGFRADGRRIHGIVAQGPGSVLAALRAAGHGAVRDALDYLGRVLDVELNSATDNPLIFPEGGRGPRTSRRRAAAW